MNLLKKILAFSLLSIILGFSSGFAFETPNPMAPAAPSFSINNRTLIRINGKVISLMDVVKKMDIIIYEHFPEIRNSPVKLYQFYSSQWRHTLDDMIFNELTIADGESKDIKVSDGDVREEMERRFGPNIISNLTKLNLKYDEVRDIIHAELLVRQLHGMKIYSKAQLSVTPSNIKTEYLSHIQKNPSKEELTYQVISVRGKDALKCKSVIEHVSMDLSLPSSKLSDLVDAVKTLPSVKDKSVTVNVSKDIVLDAKNLSEEHKSILNSLKEKEYSNPIAQVSRVDNSNVYRIFHLKSRKTVETAKFQELSEELENTLLNKAAQKEKEEYKLKLFKKFGFDSEFLSLAVPDDYQPFTIK